MHEKYYINSFFPLLTSSSSNHYIQCTHDIGYDLMTENLSAQKKRFLLEVIHLFYTEAYSNTKS